MFGDNFIRNASGIYVPPLIGLAEHPLGRFQPCGSGNCCAPAPLACGNCWSGTQPTTVWADIPAFEDNVCEECSGYEQTVLLSRVNECTWTNFDIPLGPCSVGPRLDRCTLQLYSDVSFANPDGDCIMEVFFEIIADSVPPTEPPGPIARLFQWLLNLGQPPLELSTIDHELVSPIVTGTTCTHYESIVHVYE